MFSDLWGIMETLYYSSLTLLTSATLNSKRMCFIINKLIYQSMMQPTNQLFDQRNKKKKEKTINDLINVFD